MYVERPVEILRPPHFDAPADGCRMLFDYGNETILTNQIAVDTLFIGDSITQLWDVYAFFPNQGFLVNRGIGGDTAGVVAKRLEADALQLKPARCIVLVGINDIFHMGMSGYAGTPDEMLVYLKDCYYSICTQMAEHHIPLLFGSVLPIWLENQELMMQTNALILRINQFLQSLCEQQGAQYVDYHSALSADGLTLRRDVSHDGIHPHVIGYNRMAEVLRPLLTN